MSYACGSCKNLFQKHDVTLMTPIAVYQQTDTSTPVLHSSYETQEREMDSSFMCLCHNCENSMTVTQLMNFNDAPSWKQDEQCPSFSSFKSDPDPPKVEFMTDSEDDEVHACSNVESSTSSLASSPTVDKENRKPKPRSGKAETVAKVKSYECDECKLAFTTRQALGVHRKRKHATGCTYKCESCEKSFSYQKKLEAHIKRQHVKECKLCMKTFPTAAKLKRHDRTVHQGILYNCDKCEKAFTEFANLVRHQKVHTGEKNFKCAICDKGFTLKQHLIGHMRTHTFEKPYVCEVCNAAFADFSTLKAHKITHKTSVDCPYCSKTFSAYYLLKKHKKVSHSGGHFQLQATN